MNQTLGFALEENTGMMVLPHCPLILQLKNAVNAMFTVLTSNVTASELVQQEDGNSTYSNWPLH